MTMKKIIKQPVPFYDPIPAAIMTARDKHLNDPLHGHFCVLQTSDHCIVSRHLSPEWRVIFSTRHEEEKKVFLKKKYH
ncbi:hypothetical protein fHeYen801_047c [Yersinia phage fHe-Yen8-01]|nr:hypothetical protein fHeYen801_047c [Yersinia phage fHe-Yen8-01]